MAGIWVQALHYLLELEHLNRYVFGFVERTTCWYNGFAYDYDDPSQILESATCSNFYEGCSQRESIAWFSLLNPASKAVAGRYPAKGKYIRVVAGDRQGGNNRNQASPYHSEKERRKIPNTVQKPSRKLDMTRWKQSRLSRTPTAVSAACAF
ncbi:hypothetical protein T4B_9919 [Trichinella pseudospiralis]|uniref:Uncharacterized protein n=1 Tax=Trichinella pseudospiralis TaxID=6337 RepID=A0A0V1GR50_TRIPS|nr:hypothetical protein T4B_9919 [Trichinella pseudospiralis]